MPRQLTISPAPFKSSYLSIPPSPFSPQLPISSPASAPIHQASSIDQAERRKAQLKSTAQLLPPPADPLNWLWQCHKCNRVYQLGVTRRCLDDGHLFCAGTTTVKKGRGKNGRVVRRHAACASEFDYQGWKGWGVWRRSVAEQVEAAEALLRAEEAFESVFRQEEETAVPVVPSEAKWLNGAWAKKAVHSRSPSANLRAGREYWEKTQSPLEKKEKKKNCWDACDYPSECRWGKQFGVKTPTVVTASIAATPAASNSVMEDDEETKADQPKTSFEDILLELSQSALGTSASSDSSSADITDLPLSVEEEAAEPAYLEPLSPTRSQRQKSVTEGETPKVSMDDLLESVKRRKRRSSGQIPSPLGANPPSPTTSSYADGAELERSASASATLQRASDDLELEVKKQTLQEKAGVFVKGLVIKKRRDSQSTAGSV
ncbi:hypothetical protein Slin15195_G095160 [Septoria linicola]|uniref:Uncharacterized protein n=1 Tax=Septoria linicola TaxID=215465 RepID=A0A9Q9AUP1_9PEZI|nr:hypothetical protein Slin14017_G058230 [Septoria linicola]USW56197.1 hypothetical protein Slin15195_G095160 [Septoria linicola]